MVSNSEHYFSDELIPTLEFFSEPRTLRQVMQYRRCTYACAITLLRRYVACGWLRSATTTREVGRAGRPPAKFELDHLPRSVSEFLQTSERVQAHWADVPLLEDLASPPEVVFVPDPELVAFFALPHTIGEYAEAAALSPATARNRVHLHAKRSSLHRAGCRRSSVGPPARLFCSDREAALRSLLSWGHSDGAAEVRAEQERSSPHVKKSFRERLREATNPTVEEQIGYLRGRIGAIETQLGDLQVSLEGIVQQLSGIGPLSMPAPAPLLSEESMASMPGVRLIVKQSLQNESK